MRLALLLVPKEVKRQGKSQNNCLIIHQCKKRSTWKWTFTDLLISENVSKHFTLCKRCWEVAAASARHERGRVAGGIVTFSPIHWPSVCKSILSKFPPEKSPKLFSGGLFFFFGYWYKQRHDMHRSMFRLMVCFLTWTARIDVVGCII